MHLHQILIPKNWINRIRQSRSRSICPQWRKVKGSEQNQDLRCQSGPSVKSSVIPSDGDSLRNYVTSQQRLQISDLHFEKFPATATFAGWKIRFKTEVCICSQFPHGSYALDQRSGGGWFSRWFKIFIISTCVGSLFLDTGWHTQGEGWITILPWYHPVGVAKTSVSRKGGRAGLPKNSKLPPRGTGTTVLTYPCPSRVSVAVRCEPG